MSNIYLADVVLMTTDSNYVIIHDKVVSYPESNLKALSRSISKTMLVNEKKRFILEDSLPKIFFIDFKKKIMGLEPQRKFIKSCPTWNELLNVELSKDYFKDLQNFISNERKSKIIYPEAKNTFNAFKLTPYDDVKVVIIGQDPYHSPGHAHGLAFSSLSDSRPPSLNNIFKEVYNDIYKNWKVNREAEWNMSEIFETNDLTSWAKQGVLLFNIIMTVEKGIAGSHAKKGWETLSVEIVKKLNQHPRKLVFMLWGKFAQAMKKYITDEKHLILEAAHPAAEAYKENAGFFGCKHFSKCNSFLEKNAPFHSKVGINFATFKN